MTKPIEVLLVDDMSTNRELIKVCLHGLNCRINEAADGRQAIEFLNHQQFDLAILDVMMPGMDGIELCTHIRNKPNTEDLPVVMITSLTSPEDISEMHAAGATTYLEKPFNANTLRKIIIELAQLKN